MNEFEKQEEIFKHDKFKLRLNLYELENVINSNKKGIIAVTFSYLGGKTSFCEHD